MSDKEVTFGIIKEDKVFLKSWGENPERVIGEVRDGDAKASFEYFASKFDELETKVTELEKTIEEAVNKGSFLMKLLHLKEVILQHEGLGDYQALQIRLTNQESLINDIIQTNRLRNLEIKGALIQEAAIAAEKINWKEATEDIHDIKTRWIKTGNAPNDQETKLEEEFWVIVSGFFDKKKAFYEDKKRLGVKNKLAYEALVEQAKKLANIHGKERFEKVKDLKQQWSEIGSIHKDEYGPLIDDFNKSLKPPKTVAADSFDIKPIMVLLDDYISGKEKVDLRRLEDLRGSLKTYKPTNFKAKQERRDAFSKIQLLKERDFLLNITKKRFKNFKEMDQAQRQEVQIKVLIDLLARDKEDLNKYIENGENFSSSSGQMNPMVEKKINQQKTKVAVKESLLKMLRDS